MQTLLDYFPLSTSLHNKCTLPCSFILSLYTLSKARNSNHLYHSILISTGPQRHDVLRGLACALDSLSDLMCLCSCWSIEGPAEEVCWKFHPRKVQVFPTLLKGSKPMRVGPHWDLTLMQQRTDSISEINICTSSRKLWQYYGISRNYSL